MQAKEPGHYLQYLDMEVTKIKVRNANGLHLRTAARVVSFAKRCASKISLCYKSRCADSSSVLEILSLGAPRDSDISVIVQGQDEKEVINKIGEIFSDGAGI